MKPCACSPIYRAHPLDHDLWNHPLSKSFSRWLFLSERKKSVFIRCPELLGGNEHLITMQIRVI